MDGVRRGRQVGGRRALVALAALVPLVPIAVGIAIGSGGGSAQASSASHYTPVASAAATFSKLSQTPAQTALPPGRGAVVALLRRPTRLRAAPGGRVIA